MNAEGQTLHVLESTCRFCRANELMLFLAWRRLLARVTVGELKERKCFAN